MEEAEKQLKRGLSPEQIANTVLKGKVSYVTLSTWLYKEILLYGDRSSLRHKGKKRVKRKHGGAQQNAERLQDSVEKFIFIYPVNTCCKHSQELRKLWQR